MFCLCSARRAGRPIVAGWRRDSVPPATPGPGDVTTRDIVPDFRVGCNDLDQVLGFGWESGGKDARNPVLDRCMPVAALCAILGHYPQEPKEDIFGPAVGVLQSAVRGEALLFIDIQPGLVPVA